MSLRIEWNFGEGFVQELKGRLYLLLNDPEQKVDEIYGDISVEELNPGVKAPYVEIVRVEEVTDAEVVLLVKIQYDGNFSMTLKTKAQINPLYASQDEQSDSDETSLRHCPSGAGENRPFIVPVQLSVSQIEFDAVVRVKINLQDGFVELSYCDLNNDSQVGESVEPYFQLKVSSTFDDVPVIKKYLHSLIEGKIRQFLQVDLIELVRCLSKERMRPINIDEMLQQLIGNKESDGGCCRGEELLNENSLIAGEKEQRWSFDRDALLSACYASPEGLFVVERRLLAPFEIKQRVEQLHSESTASSIKTNTPVMISFPFKSSMCHILSSFNSSLLFHKYSSSLFPIGTSIKTIQQ